MIAKESLGSIAIVRKIMHESQNSWMKVSEYEVHLPVVC